MVILEMRLICHLIVCCLFVLQAGAEPFQHHPSIRIERVAEEPQVVDPVSLAFAADGTLFVAEMRDYPEGMDGNEEPGGRIRRLSDQDGDGIFETSSIYAEKLLWPTSVLPWRDGVLVVLPTEIVFLADRDGDNRAEIRETILEGFFQGLSDSHSRGLTWGLDNLVHGCIAPSSGIIHSPKNGAQKQRLQGHDFAFDPDRGFYERTFGSSFSFGREQDRFGRWFADYNMDPLRHQVIADRYIRPSPELPTFRPITPITPEESATRLFPISEPVTRFNRPDQAGYFSGGAGIALLEGDPFGDGHEFSALIADVCTNLVHRMVIKDSDSIFHATAPKDEVGSEWLASEDQHFRPLAFTWGPGGALYLADMQRAVIEHPEYISGDVLESLDLREGSDRGRIYRITPADVPENQSALLRHLHEADLQSLIAALDGADIWAQRTAHRLLFETRPPEAPAAIRAIENPSPAGRVRHLWVLEGLAALNEEEIFSAIGSPHPELRENGILLAERHPSSALFEKIVELLQKDSHQRVRLQAALTLGGRKVPGKLEALHQASQGADLWLQRAILSSVDEEAGALLALQSTNADPNFLQALAETAIVAEASRDDGDVPAMLRKSGKKSLPGLAEGLRRLETEIQKSADLAALIKEWGKQVSEGEEASLLELCKLVGVDPPAALAKRARRLGNLALQGDATSTERLAAIHLLGKIPDSFQDLLSLLGTDTPPEFRSSALSALQAMEHPELGGALVEMWSELPPDLRQPVMELFLSTETYQLALLDGIRSEAVSLAELNLNLGQRRTLLRWSTEKVAKRAAPLIDDIEYANRRDVVKSWLEKIPPHGVSAKGREIFAIHCASCHHAEDIGHHVGPDLAGLSHRSIEDLLTHILDPNMAIDPAYATCQVETTEGRRVIGLVSAEATDSLTLLMAGGAHERIARSQIRKFQILPISLMPASFDSVLDPQQIRDLIAFIRAED